jgi:hypothetical protein
VEDFTGVGDDGAVELVVGWVVPGFVGAVEDVQQGADAAGAGGFGVQLSALGGDLSAEVGQEGGTARRRQVG